MQLKLLNCQANVHAHYARSILHHGTYQPINSKHSDSSHAMKFLYSPSDRRPATEGTTGCHGTRVSSQVVGKSSGCTKRQHILKARMRPKYYKTNALEALAGIGLDIRGKRMCRGWRRSGRRNGPSCYFSATLVPARLRACLRVRPKRRMASSIPPAPRKPLW